MRKVFAILALVALLVPVFADDALVLPAGVLRTYVTGAYAFGNSGYDQNGDSQDLGLDITAANLGFAVEYGVNDFVSAAFQWAPGWTLWSKLDPDPMAPLEGNVNGLYDLFAGAKIQVVGPNAPVQNEIIRFAVAPGIKIPMPGIDFEKQQTEAMADFLAGGTGVLTMQDADKHALGLGGRVYFDYVINEMFFMNLYSEFIKYFAREDVANISDPTGKYKLEYGYSLTLEAEPHFELALANNAKFSAGVPVTYEMWPEVKVDGAGMDNAGYSLSLSPSASYFFLAGKLPFEVKLGYTLPLMGKNVSMAMNSVVFQLKSYLKF